MSTQTGIIRTLPQFTRTLAPHICEPTVTHEPIMGLHLDNPRKFFDEFDRLMHDSFFCKWMRGYNPISRHYCVIGGIAHERGREKLKYGPYEQYAKLRRLDRMTFLRALIKEEARYDQALTLAREKCISEYDEAMRQYEQVKAREDYIAREYDVICACIKELHWNESISFQGKLYGVPLILDGVHRENDCGGRVVEITIYTYQHESTTSIKGHMCTKCHARITQ